MNKLKKLIKEYDYVIYPFLFGFFPLLSFYGSNASEIKAGDFNLSTFIVLSLIVVVVSWLAGLVFTRQKKRASIVGLALIAVFFSFGRFHDALAGFELKTHLTIIGPSKLVAGLSIIFIVGVWLLQRKWSDKNIQKINRTLLLVGSVVVGTALIPVLLSFTSTNSSSTSSVDTTSQTSNNMSSTSQSDLPDVYYILLDGYAREDVLKERFEFDNSAFINDLEKTGFYVADKSNSNYTHSHFSIPSTFNMEYVNYLAKQVGEESGDRTPLRDLMLNHKAAPAFKEIGYKYVQIGSQWGWTMESPQDDIEIKPKTDADSKILTIPLDEFALVYLQTTALKPWISTNIRSNLVARMLGAFERTEEVIPITEPTFTFTHVLSPHPPYLFDENGVIAGQTPLELDNHGFSDKEKFVAQTKYVNKLTMDLVNKILEDSSKPPIIVIASDHGPASTLTPSDFVDIDPKNLNEAGVKERMATLNALYFPDKDYSKLYPNITPINNLRVILSQYFGKDYKLLPDKSYFSGNTPGNEYKLYDVTELVNE